MPYAEYIRRGDVRLGTVGVESPWSTYCRDLPDEDWVRNFMGPEADGDEYQFRAFGEEVYEVYTGVLRLPLPGTELAFSGVLSEKERIRVEAAIRMIAGTQSQGVLADLTDTEEDEESLYAESLYPLELLRGPLLEALEALAPLADSGHLPVIIGKNDQMNPFYRLLYKSAAADAKVPLKAVFVKGLGAPETFVYPLRWEKAQAVPLHSEYNLIDAEVVLEVYGASLAIWVSLPNKTQNQLEKLSEDLRLAEFAAAGVNLGDAVVATLDATDDGTLSTAGKQPKGQLGTGAYLIGFGVLHVGLLPILAVADLLKASVRELASEALGELADEILAASEAEYANDAAAHVLLAVAKVPAIGQTLVEQLVEPLKAIAEIATLGAAARFMQALDGVIDGLGDDLLEKWLLVSGFDVDVIAATLQTELQTNGANEPVIHLGASVLDFYYDGYQSLPYEPEDDNAWPPSEAVSDSASPFPPPTSDEWLRRASPTLQFAYVLTLASELLISLMNMHSAPLAMSEAADRDGPFASMFRGLLVDTGFSCLVDVFGGASFSRFTCMLYRQAMADRFIAAWVLDGNSPDCLYEIFCWMKEQEQRDGIDRLLGAADGTGRRDYRSGVFGMLLLAVDVSDIASYDSAAFCTAWEALPCEDRELARDFIDSSGCMQSLFEDVVMPERAADSDASKQRSFGRVLGEDPLEFEIDFLGNPLDGLDVVREWDPNSGNLILGELDSDPTLRGHGGI